MAETKVGIPFIDPNVQYAGVSKLRQFNSTNLRSLDKALVIQDEGNPLAVLLSYEQFLEMQKSRESVLRTLEAFLDEDNRADLLTALQDVKEQNTRPFSEIKKTVKGDPKLKDG